MKLERKNATVIANKGLTLAAGAITQQIELLGNADYKILVVLDDCVNFALSERE